MPTSNFIPISNCFTHIMDYIPRTWNYMAELQEFETKHGELNELGKQLKTLKENVESRVAAAETQGLVCTPDVAVWLQDVKYREEGLNEVLDEGSLLLKRSCLGACSPCGCWNSQTFLGKVTSEISLVKDLKGRGNFETVSQSPPPASVQLLPEDPSVGLKSVFETALSFIEEDTAGIMGLYGMGGVGKTTLLKKMNNELAKKSYGFDVIIWVVISKEINVGGVRKHIRERLGLSLVESEDLSLLPTDIFNNLARKRFVVLLDDIWKKIDLASIGIPSPKDPNFVNRSKVVFTTRSYEVCGLMAADKNVRLECLNWDDAMELFKNKLGENSRCLRDLEIRKLSDSIVKECAGLPLALIVTAGTMASKTSVGDWHYALTTLQKNAAEFSGMAEQVFSVLKFSYDNLPNKAIRSCLLFCSLYPEDHVFRVDHLIKQWIGGGYIDGFEEWEDAVNFGYDIIGVLKGTCLLEFSQESMYKEVKMHDVIRDLAHWIARDCGGENDKFLVKIGGQVTKAPDAEKWAKAHSISMMETGITHLHHIPKCSHLSTFLFVSAYHLQHIPDNFFLYMPTLRFLDLSNNEKVPGPSFSFKMIGCLPTSIGELVSLEYLDLSGTRFEKELPIEMKKLVALKHMFLGDTNIVPVGVIKNLLNLQAVGLNISGFGNGKDDDRLAGIGELEYLPQLKHLQITSSNVKDLQVFVSRDLLASCTWSLAIEKLDDIRKLISSSSVSSTPFLSLGCMEKIRKLTIVGCPEIEEWVIDNKSSFKNLELLTLRHLPQLVVSLSWGSKNRICPIFTNLRSVNIVMCDSMVNLTWLSLAPVLQFLSVGHCSHIEGILLEEGPVTYDENTFSQLRHLSLWHLPCLQSICSYALPFPFLKEIYVYDCPQLKKLPLDSNNAQKTLQIMGSSDWWNNLEWENEADKSTFTSVFRIV
ncbi:mitogen-activated protein kinase kinase [Ranunculus cassubicifolius]